MGAASGHRVTAPLAHCCKRKSARGSETPRENTGSSVRPVFGGESPTSQLERLCAFRAPALRAKVRALGSAGCGTRCGPNRGVCTVPPTEGATTPPTAVELLTLSEILEKYPESPLRKKLIVVPALQARGKEKGLGSPSSCERAEPQAPPWPGE